MLTTLPIDLDELTIALTHHDSYTGSSRWFDSRTGALIFVNDGVDAEDLPDDLAEHREAWFAFERIALERIAREWCEERGITPQWTGFGARAIGVPEV